MGLDEFASNEVSSDTDNTEDDMGPALVGGESNKNTSWEGRDLPPMNGENTRYCPECIEECEWDGRAYQCENPECPNKSFIGGFKETPYFGSPLKTLPPSREDEGKRNKYYGGDKNDYKAIHGSEEDTEEEENSQEDDSGGLSNWL